MAATPPPTPALRVVRNKRRTSRGRRLASVAALAWLCTLAVNRSLIEVRGTSMLPTLWPGDRVLTLPRVGPLRPGAVVVLRDPADPDHLVVKRVHATGEEGVDVRGDHPDASTDSRHFGPVPAAVVRRRVLRRWPDLRAPLGPAPGADALLRDDVRR